MNIAKTVLIELTYKCNHECLFCYCPWLRFPDLVGRELDCSEWIAILDKLAAAGVKHITFSGGEPLLKKDIGKLLTHAAALPFEFVTVFSNGLLIDENMLDVFGRYKIQWATSLPGIFSFRYLTNSAMTSRQLLGKVRLAARKNVSVTVSITVGRKNLWETALTMLTAKFFGASALSVGACMPEGRALEHPELCLSDKQYHKLLLLANRFNSVLNIPIRFSYEQRCECYNLDGIPSGTVPEHCNAGKDFMVISPDGGVRKCMHSPEKICMIDKFLNNDF